MKIVTWNKDNDAVTIAVLFDNGTSAAESAKTFTTEEAKKAIAWLRKHCGAHGKSQTPRPATRGGYSTTATSLASRKE